MEQSEFIAPTIKEALEKAKKKLGADTYIINSEETPKGIKIIATNELPLKGEIEKPYLPKQEEIPITREMVRNIKTEIMFSKKPMDAIKFIIDICKKQELGSSFCDAWLDALSADLKKESFFLDDSLNCLMHFNDEWIQNLNSKTPVILVGPPGSGKTATLGKMALILKSLKRNIKIISFDTQKAAAIQQLETYIAPLKLKVHTGYEDYLKVKEESLQNDQILLIDTPGINILSDSRQDYFFKLSQKIRDPLTLVLANDFNSTVMHEIAKEFKMYNTEYLIGTRFDVYQSYGGFFSTAYHNKLTPVLYSDSPKISDPLRVLCPRKTLNLFTK